MRWANGGTHPHLNTPTLLSYVHGYSGSSYTYDVMGYSNGLQTGWTAGYYTTSSAQYTASSYYYYSGYPSQMTEQTIVAGMTYGQSTVYDLYKGTVYAVMLYKQKFGTSDRNIVENWLGQRYGLSCGSLTALNANTKASNGILACPPTSVNGGVCLQTCDTSIVGSEYYQEGGPSSLTCQNGRWVGKNIVCQRRCPRIAAPTNYAGCTKYVHWDTFNSTADNFLQYDVSPALADRQFKIYWRWNTGGYMEAYPPQSDDACSVMDPTTLIVNQPIWISSIGLSNTATSELDIYLPYSGARGGISVRWLSDGNQYAFSVAGDNNSPTMQFQKQLSGTWSTVASSGSALVPLLTVSGAWHRLKVVSTGSSIQCFINETMVFDLNDGSIPSGSYGLYAYSGPVRYDNFRVATVCDENGASCRSMSHTQVCAFSCADGFKPVGPTAFQCMSGSLTPGTPVCQAVPPSVTNYTWSIYDDAATGTSLGVLNATAFSAKQTITYGIISGNTETLKDHNNNVLGSVNPVFTVGLCDGVVRLSQSGILDYYVQTKVFRILVRAYVNGDTSIYSELYVNVNVMPGPKPPIFDRPNGTTTRYPRYVQENVAVNTSIAFPVTAYKADGLPVVYDIVFGNQDNIFAIDATTGQLRVNKAVLNYEVTPVYNIMVRARDANRTTLSDTIMVDIYLVDVNDPPIMPARQSFTVLEDLAFMSDPARNITGPIPWPIVATDEDGADYLTWAIRVGPVTLFNLSSTTGLMVLNANLNQVFFDHNRYPTFYIDGYSCRGYYDFNITATDTRGVMAWSAVRVYILANTTLDGLVPTIDQVAVPAGTMMLAGGDDLSITGSNFDAALSGTFLMYCNISTQTGDPTGNRTYALTGITYIAPNRFAAKSPVGWGTGLAVICRWSTNGIKQVQIPTPVFLSYGAPVINFLVPSRDAISPRPDTTALKTVGSEQLEIVGYNFGPSNAPRTILYGNNFEYTGTIINVVSALTGAVSPSDTYLRFSTAPGVGANLPVKVIVGQLTSAVASTLVSYAPPSISRVDSTDMVHYNISAMSDLGNQVFGIWGSNFGAPGIPVMVKYSSTQNIFVNGATVGTYFSFTPTNCRKPNPVTAHTYIECTSVPGIGVGHKLEMIIGGQTTGLVATPGTIFSYQLPNVTGISGPGTSLADTTGGQVVILSGTHFGPVMMGNGEGVTAPPLSVSYGRTGVEYQAQSCSVTTDSTAITCVTAPGTGKNHVWKVWVAGIATPTLNANTSYAPPSIIKFTRPGYPEADPAGVRQYVTFGNEPVVITGKNFGPALVTYTAQYRVQLRQTMTDYGIALGDADGNIFYTPSSCVLSVPHTEITCYTNKGAGANLQWLITVDGQASTLPVVAYAAPTITMVRAESNGNLVTSASTDGGIWIRLTGTNFGPAINCRNGTVDGRLCGGYVQSVKYGVDGATYKAANYDVVSDTVIRAKLTPGFGTNLKFTVMVADQVSDLSAESFSFALPKITILNPPTGATTPDPKTPVIITVTGTDFALLDPTAQVGILFGNPLDNSVSSKVLSVQTRVPSYNDAASLVTYITGSSAHKISFQLPPGLLPDRAVRAVVYKANDPTGYRVMSDPLTVPSDKGMFTYMAPDISAVVVQAANRSDVSVAGFLTSAFPVGTDLSAALQIRIYGTNFGQAASDLHDSILRLIQTNTTNNWDMGAAMPVYSWSDTQIMAFTLSTKAIIRVAVQGYALNGSVIGAVSGPYEYVDLSPMVGNLADSALKRFDTRGGEILEFTAMNLKSVISTLAVTVGGRDCPLLDSNNATVPANLVKAQIIDIVPGVTSSTVWYLRCVIPAGQGVNQPIVIRRDSSLSDSGTTISYRAPSIDAIWIWSNVQQKWIITTLNGQTTTNNIPSTFIPTDGTKVIVSR
jgi:hypothetical protein